MQIAPTIKSMRLQRVSVELAAAAMAITRSTFSNRRISEWAIVTGGTGGIWSIAHTLLDGEARPNERTHGDQRGEGEATRGDMRGESREDTAGKSVR